jgi:hypothetical protein
MGRHDAKGLQRFTGSRPGGSTSAVADLQLMLHNRGLMLACASAIVVPFVVYFAVIMIAGKMGDWALFLFAPMVTVGVAVGALLDRAYAHGHHK